MIQRKQRARKTYVMSRKLEKELLAISRDVRLGRNISPVFTNARDAIAHLKKA